MTRRQTPLPRFHRKTSPLCILYWCATVSVVLLCRFRYPIRSESRELTSWSSPSQVGTLVRKRPPQQIHCNCNKTNDTSSSRFHPADQQWSHATNSRHALKHALSDPRISAIEADIIMGNVKGEKGRPWIPVMSHPPSRTSDLSLEDFLETVTNKSPDTPPTLVKHVKLDFKEMQALEPTFQWLHDLGYIDPNGKMVVLNADLFAGPGRRFHPPPLDADEFMSTAMRLIDSLLENNYKNKTGSERLRFAFSIGHAVDSRSVLGYTIDDMVEVLDLIDSYFTATNNRSDVFVIYCANAHLLLKDVEPVDFLMDQLPHNSQLLVWTGHGEIPISREKIEMTKAHFIKEGTISRVAFDVQVANSVATGFFYDTFNTIYGMFVGAFRTVQYRVSELC